MEERLGILPYHDQGCNEGFNSSALYTTSFGFRNSWRLQATLLHRQQALLDNSYFQWGGNLLAKRDVNPTATRSAAPLLFTHMAYMAAHRPEPSATPNAQLYGIGFNCLHAGQQCLQSIS